jgi:hypothetical protein
VAARAAFALQTDRAACIEENWNGLQVHRPRFTVWPVVGQAKAGRSVARALLPRLRALRQSFAFDVIDAEYFWPDGCCDALGAGARRAVLGQGAGERNLSLGGRAGIGEQIRAAAEAAAGLLAVSASLKDEMVRRGMPSAKIMVHTRVRI